MKVGMVIGALEGGGMGTVVDSLLGELKKKGIEVEIITKKLLVAPPKGVKVHLVKTTSLGTTKMLEKFDVVHVNGGSLLTLPAAFAKVPKIFTFHGQTPPEMHGGHVRHAKALAIEMLYRAMMRKFDVIASTSRFGQEDIRKRYGIGKSIWIPNGVERKMFHKVSNGKVKRIREKYSHPLLLGVGSLYAVKGWEFMLDCFEELLKRERNATLLIAGDGVQEKELKRRVEGSKLRGHVVFLGKVNLKDLNDYYNACDLYVSGSPYEGFCLPAVEALACGKPICVRKKGAMTEHALLSGCGTVFEKKEEFAGKALEALGMPAKEIGIRSEKYLGPFSWEKVAGRYAEVYRSMVK
ncbi:MAG: glycosyltransferase family 4 protein [Candidatus Micrarchaeota archaeon]